MSEKDGAGNLSVQFVPICGFEPQNEKNRVCVKKWKSNFIYVFNVHFDLKTDIRISCIYGVLCELLAHLYIV